MYRAFVGSGSFAFLVAFVTLAAAQAPEQPAGKYEYVGTKTCKKCHIEVWESWAKTKMANSFQVLKANAELKPDEKTGLTDAWIAEIKASKAKGKPTIEPEKDYTRQADCLKCHTTGYGQPSGYAIPDPKDKKAQRKAEQLEGVTCESCHGPGSAYVKIFEEIQEKQRPYTRAELYAAGMYKIGPEICATCHNKESPLVGDDYVFDYEKRKAEGTHKHGELKLRKE